MDGAATGFERRRLATRAKAWKWVGFLMFVPAVGFLDWARSTSDQDIIYLLIWCILGFGLLFGALLPTQDERKSMPYMRDT